MVLSKETEDDGWWVSSCSVGPSLATVALPADCFLSCQAYLWTRLLCTVYTHRNAVFYLISMPFWFSLQCFAGGGNRKRTSTSWNFPLYFRPNNGINAISPRLEFEEFEERWQLKRPDWILRDIGELMARCLVFHGGGCDAANFAVSAVSVNTLFAAG